MSERTVDYNNASSRTTKTPSSPSRKEIPHYDPSARTSRHQVHQSSYTEQQKHVPQPNFQPQQQAPSRRHEHKRQTDRAHVLDPHKSQQRQVPLQRDRQQRPQVEHVHPSNSQRQQQEHRDGFSEEMKLRKDQQPQRQFQQSQRSWPPIEMERGEFPPLAQTMNVNSIVIHCTPKQNVTSENPTAPTTNNLNDLVSYICATWKRQVDALALAPVEQINFYKRLYDQLFQALSISVFSKTPNDDRPPSTSVDKRRMKDLSKVLDKVTPNHDLIIYEGGKSKQYVYRRVESADKYARRTKIPSYIRIKTEGNEQTKDIVACFQAIDRKFVVDKEKRSLSDLYREMSKRISAMPLEHEPIIDFVGEADMQVEEDVDRRVHQGPPTKKRKVEQPKEKVRRGQLVKRDRTDKTNLDKAAVLPPCKKDPQKPKSDEERKEKKRESDGDEGTSESSDSSSESSHSGNDDEEEERTELVLAAESCNSDLYVPTGQADPSSVPNYVPTPLSHPVDINQETIPPIDFFEWMGV